MWDKLIHADDVPELPPATKELFLVFYNMAGGSIAHPNDLRKFNEFIRHAHARRIKLSGDNFKQMLLRIGCVESRAEKLSNIYHYGRALLKRDIR